MRAVMLDADTFGESHSFSLLSELPMEWVFYPTTTREEVVDRIRDADVIVTNKVAIGAAEIKKTKAKLIAVTATGYNVIDAEAAKAKGISVCNVPAYSTDSVVQHIFTLILALSCNLLSYVDDIRGGKWQRSKIFTMLEHPIHALKGKTLGIIGYGAQGKEVERIAKAFHMKVLIAKHTASSKHIAEAVHLHEMLGHVDVLVICLPLTPKTKNLITYLELELMKPSAILINTARGAIVNEQDLALALKNKTIAGAGIDVLSEEPPKPSHPLLQKDVPNLILTPHIAWASSEARTRCLEITKSNIEAFLKGKPQNIVNE